MTQILLSTRINAPVERVYDLSRSIDLHTRSMKHTGEKAVAGKTKGLLDIHETVTWQARHLGKVRYLTIAITSLQPLSYFRDEMLKGDFSAMIHHHHFREVNGKTLMTDDFRFASPFGWLGRLVNYLFLSNYMKKLLEKRNSIIKQYAETNEWKTILSDQ